MSLLPEEPLKNACVGGMSVADNLAFREFDRAPFASGGWWLNGAAFRIDAEKKIGLYKIKTRTPDTPISALSGGNVQRAVLARELGGEVEVLIAANPCFGLDFAAVAQIHAEIMAARNRGAAVLLVSEDLDELLELSDRLMVMFHGQLVYEARASEAISRKSDGIWRGTDPLGAFSSEAGTGSRQENASKQQTRVPVLTQSEPILLQAPVRSDPGLYPFMFTRLPEARRLFLESSSRSISLFKHDLSENRFHFSGSCSSANPRASATSAGKASRLACPVRRLHDGPSGRSGHEQPF